MDPARDPRSKRRPSRSPEGGQARKLQKPVQTNTTAGPPNGATAPTNPAALKKPSREPGEIRPSPIRRDSGHIDQNARQESSNLFVKSPNRTASVNGDSSGRSTPVQKSNGTPGLNKPSNEGTTSTIGLTNANADSTSESMFKLLTSFSDHIEARAVDRIYQKQAEDRAKRAQLEYNTCRKQFDDFPPIKEHKTAAKEAAQKELAVRNEKLQAHKAVTERSMTELANLLSQHVSRTDQVPRAEFDKLSTTCNGLEKELHVAKGTIESLQKQLVETNSNVAKASRTSDEVASIQDHVNKVEKRVEDVSRWKTVAEQGLREAKNLTSSIRAAHSVAENVKNQLSNFVSGEAKSFASKKDLANIKQKTDTLQKDVGQLKASKVASNVTSNPKALSSIDAEFKQKVALLAEQGPALVKRVDELQEKMHNLEEAVGVLDRSPNDASTKAIEDIKTRLNKIDMNLNDVWNSIDSMKGEVQEEGKGPLLQHFKKLDLLVNNLHSQVHPSDKPPLRQRLSTLELDQAALQDDLKNRATQHNQGVKEPTSTDTTIFERLNSMDDRIDKQEEISDQRDELVISSIDSRIQEVRTELSEKNANLFQYMTTIEHNIGTVQRNLQDSSAALAGKMSSDAFLTFQAEQKWQAAQMKADIKELQNEQMRARAPSQTPGPTQSTTPQLPAASMLPANATATLPQLLNGVNVSPSLNEAATPPRFGSPHEHGAVQLPPAQSQDIKRLQAQLDQLVHVTQHLKQRYDNLQTDEVAKMMVDQMSQMYPHAKNFEAAVLDVKQRIAALQAEIRDLRTEKDSALQHMNNYIGEAKKSAADANLIATRAEKAAKDAESVTHNHTSSIKDINDMLSKITVDTAKTSSDLTKVEVELKTTSGIAKEVQRIFSFAKPQETREKLNDHIDRFENALVTIEKESKRKDDILTAMQKSIGKCEGEVEAIKETHK